MTGLFKSMKDALAQGGDAVLVSVVASSGSVPRGEGAKMAVYADRSEGTVGGGAVEFRCQEIAREMLKTHTSGIHSFTLQPGDPANLGMVCGGNVEVCFQYFSHEDQDTSALLDALVEAGGQIADSWLVTRMDGDKIEMGLYDRQRGLRFHDGVDVETVADMARSTSVLLNGLFVEPYTHAGVVYIFGGGHVAQALMPVLAPLDFHAVIFEDRPEFVPEGGILGSFDNIGEKVHITENDYIVIMTRGHEADRIVLAQALRTSAQYIGMIGSRKKIAATHALLREQGFSDADFARIHNPIGLPIGGQTPAEIAISIAAEMIAHRAKAR